MEFPDSDDELPYDRRAARQRVDLDANNRPVVFKATYHRQMERGLARHGRNLFLESDGWYRYRKLVEIGHARATKILDRISKRASPDVLLSSAKYWQLLLWVVYGVFIHPTRFSKMCTEKTYVYDLKQEWYRQEYLSEE